MLKSDSKYPTLAYIKTFYKYVMLDFYIVNLQFKNY